MIERIRRFLFLNQSVRQTIAKNTFWLSFGEITGRVLRTGVVIYAARVLGPAEWGMFSYAVSFAALLTVFSDIGLGAVLIREGAKYPEARARYFSTTFLLKLCLIAASFLAIVFLGPRLATLPLSLPLLLFVGLLFVFDSLRGFGVGIFRATEKMEREAFVNIITQGGILFFGLFALFTVKTSESLAAAYAGGSAIGLFVAAVWLSPYLRDLFLRFDRSLARSIIRAAAPFSLAAVLGAVMLNTDTIMIGWFLGAAEVGFYSAAQKPILFLYILPSLIAGGFFPALARFAQQDNERFRRILEKGLKVVFLISLPATIGLFFVADEAIALLYGGAYAPAVLPLQILAFTIVTAFPLNILTNGIFAYNAQKTLAYSSAAGAASNIVLNALFIPHWGIAGAALATLATQFILNAFLWKKMRELNPFSLLPSLKKIACATLLMTALVVILAHLEAPLLLTAPAAALIYVATLFFLKEELVTELRAMLEAEKSA